MRSEIEGFPYFICYSTFGSLIPTNIRGYKLLRTAYLYHKIRLDKVLNSKNKDHKPDVARIDNFLQISIDTKYYSMEKRIIFLQNVGPLEADGDINPIYIESLRIAASRVKSFEIPY